MSFNNTSSINATLRSTAAEETDGALLAALCGSLGSCILISIVISFVFVHKPSRFAFFWDYGGERRKHGAAVREWRRLSEHGRRIFALCFPSEKNGAGETTNASLFSCCCCDPKRFEERHPQTERGRETCSIPKHEEQQAPSQARRQELQGACCEARRTRCA